MRVARCLYFFISFRSSCFGFGFVGLSEWSFGKDPLAEVLFFVTSCYINFVGLLSCLHTFLSEPIDILTVKLWANQVDLVLVGHSKEALSS